ncbi:PQQ-dependent sugar dehydrogenase [Jannaschia sp. CCS1]|uniref:PQQ-dependent sugar dehydrogenase n=1 Tax=Jannaschia sp. (strain CCS1) TaxID=290400 RepID=UPI000053AD86|nr:PQQ-dependent sugar dehydrogenase [Jannaschia sp. CCS1]ABD54536.1 glucose sorbosone dehydrogenase [Jannaschia sp. CCS1]
MLRISPALSLSPLLAVLLAGASLAQAPVDDGTANLPDTIPAFEGQTDAPEINSGATFDEEVITGALSRPWGLAVLPDGAGYIVTERGGTLRHITRDGTMGPEISGVPNVRAMRQGGLLDVTLAPDFDDSRILYLTYAARDGLAGSATALARATLSDDHTALEQVTELWRQTPASAIPAHFGSRVIVQPDGGLIVTTGDRFTSENRQLAQDPVNAAYGVVVGFLPDGSPTANDALRDVLPGIVSYGHRNSQGAAIQPGTDLLWTLEHGPAGGDELNIIEEGGNYGWPMVSYGVNYNGSDVGSGEQAHAPDFIEPRYFWDPSIAPSDMVFYDGDMFPDWQGDILLGALAGQALVRLDIDGTSVIGEERFRTGEGRVRDVELDADGAILILIDDDPGALIRLTPAAG